VKLIRIASQLLALGRCLPLSGQNVRGIEMPMTADRQISYLDAGEVVHVVVGRASMRRLSACAWRVGRYA